MPYFPQRKWFGMPAGKIDSAFAKTGKRFRAKRQRYESARRFETAQRCHISDGCPK
jgi:hypothetical protein